MALQSVEHPTLSVPLEFDAKYGIYLKQLQPCQVILDQHKKIWFGRKPGEISQRLRHASILVDSLFATAASVDNPNQMKIHLQVALRGTSWDKIIKSIWCLKGGSEEDKKLVLEHRYALQRHLLGFMDAIKAHFETQELISDGISWQKCIECSIEAVKAVDANEGGVEDALKASKPSMQTKAALKTQ